MSGDFYFDKAGNSIRETSTLRVWDKPGSTPSPIGSRNQFLTYVAVGNEIVYRIDWQANLTPKRFAGMDILTLSYDGVGGGIADSILPVLDQDNVLYGDNLVDENAPVTPENLIPLTTPNLLFPRLVIPNGSIDLNSSFGVTPDDFDTTTP